MEENTITGAFISSLKRNNKQIRDDRATSIGEDAQLLYKRFIEDLRVQIKRMIRDQENMLDLSPDNATSLKLASDFNATEYVEKDTQLSFKIRDARIRLELAIERYKYLFAEEI